MDRQLFTNVRSASTSDHPYPCISLDDISRIPGQKYGLHMAFVVARSLASAPRWVIRKLTATYPTLWLADIGRH